MIVSDTGSRVTFFGSMSLRLDISLNAGLVVLVCPNDHVVGKKNVSGEKVKYVTRTSIVVRPRGWCGMFTTSDATQQPSTI